MDRSITVLHIREDIFETQSTKEYEFSHSLIIGTMNARNRSIINAQINLRNKNQQMWRRAASYRAISKPIIILEKNLVCISQAFEDYEEKEFKS